MPRRSACWRSASPASASSPTASCAWCGCSASRPARRWTGPGCTTRPAAARSGSPSWPRPPARWTSCTGCCRGPARLVDRVVPEIADWAVGAAARSARPAWWRRPAARRPTPTCSPSAVAEVDRGRRADLPGADDDPLDCAVLPLTARGRVLGTLALRMAARARRDDGRAGLPRRPGRPGRAGAGERPALRAGTADRPYAAAQPARRRPAAAATRGSRWRPTTRRPRRTSRSAATGSTPS